MAHAITRELELGIPNNWLILVAWPTAEEVQKTKATLANKFEITFQHNLTLDLLLTLNSRTMTCVYYTVYLQQCNVIDNVIDL